MAQKWLQIYPFFSSAAAAARATHVELNSVLEINFYIVCQNITFICEKYFSIVFMLYNTVTETLATFLQGQ